MFKFECMCCGDCCSGEMDIYLNLFDLYKIGKHLKLTNTSELFNKQIVKLKPGQNRLLLPVINFKSVPYRFCPFLINDMDEDFNLKGYCSLHPYKKPLVCILAPISKYYSTSNNSTDYTFTKPTENCPGINTDKIISINNTVEITQNEIKYEETFFNYLNSIISNNISNYEDRLFHLDLTKEFDIILSDMDSFFLANR